MANVYLFGAGASCDYRGVKGGFFHNGNFFDTVDAMWKMWTGGPPLLPEESLLDQAPDHYDGGKWMWPELERLLVKKCGQDYRNLGLEATFGAIHSLGVQESDLFLRAIELSLFYVQRGSDSMALGAHLEFARRKVGPGDMFITFNYDPLIELALQHLAQDGASPVRWRPSDGYGLGLQPLSVTSIVPAGTRPHVIERADSETVSREAGEASNVHVLKLHGSVDWLCRADRTPSPPFGCLREFDRDPRGQGYMIYFDGDAPMKPVIVPPLPRKNYKQFGLSDLWEKAAHALAGADSLTVVGYSLPETDTASLELLLGISETQRAKLPATFVTRSAGPAFESFKKIFPEARLETGGFAAYALRA